MSHIGFDGAKEVLIPTERRDHGLEVASGSLMALISHRSFDFEQSDFE